VIDTIRSEWIKLRTVRMNAVLMVIAVAFPLVITGLTAALIDPDNFDAEDLVGLVTGTSVVSGMLLGVIGAAGITSEFGFGTIRPTFAATPSRSRVIIAKAIVTVVVGAAVQAVMVIVCFGVGAVLLNGRGGDVSLSGAGDARWAMVGIVCFAGIVSLLGLGLGLLIRSTPAAVSVLILWPLVVETLIATLFVVAGWEDALKWMPYQAGFNLGNPDAGSTSDTLGRWTGGLYFLAVVLTVTAIGAWSTSKRDA
jgi:ABC-2 type transport system permease protein